MQGTFKEQIRQRAGCRCEYCRLPEWGANMPFQVDHIVARKHGGRTIGSNLALACLYCNRFKGPNIAGIDPATHKLCRLFHPRLHRWDWHFRWNGPTLIGRTAIGRTTIRVLEINGEPALLLRESLMAEGIF